MLAKEAAAHHTETFCECTHLYIRQHTFVERSAGMVCIYLRTCCMSLLLSVC